MYFAANAIGGQAYAKMRADPGDAVAARIAPVGRSRIGDPAAQTQASEQTVAAAPAATAAGTQAQEPAQAPESATASADVGFRRGGRSGSDRRGRLRRFGGRREDLPERLLRMPHDRSCPGAEARRPGGMGASARAGHGGSHPVLHQRERRDATQRRICAPDRGRRAQRNRFHARQGRRVGRRLIRRLHRSTRQSDSRAPVPRGRRRTFDGRLRRGPGSHTRRPATCCRTLRN